MQGLEQAEMRDLIFDGAVLTHLFKRDHLLCTPHGGCTHALCLYLH